VVDFYERLLAKTNDQAEAADREQAQRVKRAHELAADIDQFAGKIQKSLRSITTEDTTVTVNDDLVLPRTTPVIFRRSLERSRGYAGSQCQSCFA
jgi:hypothetical protein